MYLDWSAYAYAECEETQEVARVRKIRNGIAEPWGFPGGKRRPSDKTVLQTMLRELREETGLCVLGHQATLIYSTRRRKKKRLDETRSYAVHFYRVRVTAKQMEKLHAGTPAEEVGKTTRSEIENQSDFDGFQRSVIKRRLPISRPEEWDRVFIPRSSNRRRN